MKRIPPEIDGLMWLIAEDGNVQAVEAFEARHPEYRLELAKRVAMLRGLKSGRSGSSSTIPEFHPKPAPHPSRRPLLAVSLGVLLVGMAFGSYYLTSALIRKPPAPAPTPTVRVRPATPPPVVAKAPPVQAPPIPNPAPVERPPVAAPAPPSKWVAPTNFKIEGAPLSAVFKALSLQTGLAIQVAPGLEDFEVGVEYTQRTPAEILKDMGTRFGFTAFDQGGGNVLIIPATDRRSSDGVAEAIRPQP